ncbi:MAG TPA: AAA family ATPase [Thermoplasmata archaeon]|nr:AAA family ATPase [Thermoplasmata archaeon]
MPSLPTPLLRALEGVTEFTGRTLVIAGPPLSGKSRILGELRQSLAAHAARVIDLRGSYHSRSVPYGALDGLRQATGAAMESLPGAALEAEGDLPAPIEGPLAPIAFNPDRLPRRRRSRGASQRTTFLGQPIRGRSANEGDPEGYWREILPEFRSDHPHPVALLIEDAALFDSESREFIVSLTQRARLRPFVIALTLDTSVAGATLWEERLFGRGDVDWIRTKNVAADPREVRRLKEVFENLPPATQKVAGYIALLGGNVGEVVLARVSRLNFPQLAEAILPATGVGLLRAQEGRLTIPHVPWISLTIELLPEANRRQMHHEIAEALGALSPEPNLSRRIEVARHYLAAGPGPMAMASLLEAAEISIQLLSFDTAADLLTDAVGCLPSMSPNDRRPVEPEIRLLYARALFYVGRPLEAEAQVREAIDGAIAAELPAPELGELVEPLLLAMRVVGPRHSLMTTLVELAERCHEARLTEIEVLLEVLLAEFHRERNQLERSRAEAHRAAVLARKLPERYLQALGLLTMGFSRIDGDATDQDLADRFLRAARVLLVQSRRWDLDHLAGDFEARLLERQGALGRARAMRERSLLSLQREKLLSVELYHVLGIAETLLDQRLKKGLDDRLARGGTIVETIHLLPPSPGLLRLWLLDGRRMALAGETEGARDRWSALVDLPAALAIPRVRAEAMVRLALLEFSTGGVAEGKALEERLCAPDASSALPPGWTDWIGNLESIAPASGKGGGPFPPTPETAPVQEKAKKVGASP